jgi:hypothetical protein
MDGAVINYSSKTLWVVNTDSGQAIAHKLATMRRSPKGCDADGFKAVDGTPVNGHTSWVKVTDISTAGVSDGPNGELTRGCIACYNVDENEFGAVTYMAAEGWGEPL